MPTYTGDMIRKYRTEKGLTQKKLGELCGIADSNIRKYESGNQNPKIETLQKIADALDIPVNRLLAGKIISRDELKEKTLGIWSDSSCTRHRRRTDCIGKL